jgi:cytochrome c556
MRIRRIPGLGLALLACAALGCGAPRQLRYEEELERTPPAAAHAVHSQRLAELMRGLERLRGERLPQNMEVSVQEERRAEQIAEVARSMQASAARIPNAAAEAGLDAEERQDFAGLARQLEEQAGALVADATRLSPDELRERADAIQGTCDACHQRFRIPEASP